MTSLSKLIMGSIGVGKTYEAKKRACQFVANSGIDRYLELCHEEHLIEYIQISPNYDYDSFVAGIDVTCVDGQVLYQTVDKVFSSVCKKAQLNRNNRYCIILDDIDKVNISSVFGELINAIEYRNEEITLMGGGTIIVPDNLLIIATASTMNNSVSDYAILRRFDLETLKSNSQVIREYYANFSEQTVDAIVELYDSVNRFIKDHISWDKLNKVFDYLIGHTLFFVDLNIDEEAVMPTLNKKIKYLILPIIRQFYEDEILDCSFYELESFINSMYISEECPAVNNSNKIRKYQFVDGAREYEEEKTAPLIRAHYEALVVRGNERGLPALLFEDIFDATYASNILDFNKLFAEIYTNTSLVNIKNDYGTVSYPQRSSAYIVKSSDSQNFKYVTRRGEVICDVYANYATNAIESKSLYEILNDDYLIISGFRTADTSCSPNNTYEPSLSAPLNINILIYKLLVAYYRLIISSINDGNNQDLLKLAKVELFYIISNSSRFRYSNLHNMVLSLSILWSQAGTTINVDQDKLDELYNYSVSGNGLADFNEMFENEYHLQGDYPIEIISIGDNNMPSNYKTIMDDLNMHQIILQGPPGTSKTYSAKEFIGNRIISEEGLTGVSFSDALAANKLTTENYDETVAVDKSVVWDIVQFHPAYDYEDFVRGIEVTTTPTHQINYNTVNKLLGKIAKIAGKAENQNKEFYLVIDEINRANVSGVFGELIYALECRDEAVSTPYKVNGDSSLVIPSNLYIIGTMNTADKSIGGIDYAIRRRFAFVNCLPNYDVVESQSGVDSCECKAFKIVEEIFDKYLCDDYSKDDLQIGHTYFLRKSEDNYVEQMQNRMRYQIIPILREYYKDGIIENLDLDSSEAATELFSIIENYSTIGNIETVISNWLNEFIN